MLKEQVSREITAMMLNCISSGKNTFLFPNYGNLMVKLKPNIMIRDWVTKYIEDRSNITKIKILPK